MPDIASTTLTGEQPNICSGLVLQPDSQGDQGVQGVQGGESTVWSGQTLKN